jgi:hypothetical protein
MAHDIDALQIFYANRDFFIDPLISQEVFKGFIAKLSPPQKSFFTSYSEELMSILIVAPPVTIEGDQEGVAKRFSPLSEWRRHECRTVIEHSESVQNFIKRKGVDDPAMVLWRMHKLGVSPEILKIYCGFSADEQINEEVCFGKILKKITHHDLVEMMGVLTGEGLKRLVDAASKVEGGKVRCIEAVKELYIKRGDESASMHAETFVKLVAGTELGELPDGDVIPLVAAASENGLRRLVDAASENGLRRLADYASDEGLGRLADYASDDGLRRLVGAASEVKDGLERLVGAASEKGLRRLAGAAIKVKGGLERLVGAASEKGLQGLVDAASKKGLQSLVDAASKVEDGLERLVGAASKVEDGLKRLANATSGGNIEKLLSAVQNSETGVTDKLNTIVRALPEGRGRTLALRVLTDRFAEQLNGTLSSPSCIPNDPVHDRGIGTLVARAFDGVFDSEFQEKPGVKVLTATEGLLLTLRVGNTGESTHCVFVSAQKEGGDALVFAAAAAGAGAGAGADESKVL